MSCFRDKTHEIACELGKDLKTYAAQNSYTIQMLRNEGHIIQAATQMESALSLYGIDACNLDSLGQTLLELYDREQQVYLTTQKFNLVSTLSFVLLELGIIKEIQDVQDVSNMLITIWKLGGSVITVLAGERCRIAELIAVVDVLLVVARSELSIRS